MKVKLIGEEFGGDTKWIGCAIGKDGCMYSMPLYDYTQILKINPANDTATLVGSELKTLKWFGCIAGFDGCIYGIPENATRIVKFDPDSQEVSLVGKKVKRSYTSATVALNGIIHFIPNNGGKILVYDPANGSTALIGDYIGFDEGWKGVVIEVGV